MQHEFHKLEENVEAAMHQVPAGHKGEEARELSLWDKWVDCENPDTFGFLELAKDGGFSEVKDLYAHSRWLSAGVLLIFVVYNVISVIILDTGFMTDPAGSAAALGTTEQDLDKFYFSRTTIEMIAPHLGYSEGDIPTPVQTIGMLELLFLGFFLLDFCYCTFMVFTNCGFRKWFAVQKIFWDILPALSVYSAMRLLYNVVPLVLVANANDKITAIQTARAGKGSVGQAVLNLVSWVLYLIFCFMVGFDTFLMKLRIVSAAANSNQLNSTVLLSTVQFFIQVIGVVQLGTFVKKRLFVFIFGGEDGVMQDEEIVLMETWNSLLCKRMHRDLKFYQFLAVVCSFSDEDFQSLVLNENADVKMEVTRSIHPSKGFKFPLISSPSDGQEEKDPEAYHARKLQHSSV